jgi:hypothetical protein
VYLQVDADVSEKHAVSIFREVSPKRRHRPANIYGAKTQHFTT